MKLIQQNWQNGIRKIQLVGLINYKTQLKDE